jgi:benzylsuccinate CoA-transferase BbsF subunit
MSAKSRTLPLESVVVLDFTWAAVGPYATFLLALLGATVIRVESPRRSHLQRTTAGFYRDLSAPKTTILVDVTDPRGREVALGLAERADAAVDNYRAGVMDRLGLGPETLRARNPQLVVVSATAMGATGPEAVFGGYAPIFSALGGLAHLTGYPDEPPTELRHPVDFSLGALAALGATAALIRQRRTGEGAHVDMSCREGVTQLIGDTLLAFQLTGEVPDRTGSSDPIMAPHGAYRCRGDEAWVSVAVATDAEWAGLAGLVGRPELSADPRYADAYLRWEHRAELDALVAEWALSQTPAAAAAALQEAGVPAAPCTSARDLFDDEHLATRRFASTTRRAGATVTTIGAPWKLSSAPARLPRGRDGAAARAFVFEDLLGLEADDVKALRREGVVG